MNRETKRMLAKQQAAADKERARRPQPTAAAKLAERKEPMRKRLPKFVREARGELKKVSWPSRGEVAVYTTVVLISVTVITSIVFGLDYGFGKLVLKVYGG